MDRSPSRRWRQAPPTRARRTHGRRPSRICVPVTSRFDQRLPTSIEFAVCKNRVPNGRRQAKKGGMSAGGARARLRTSFGDALHGGEGAPRGRRQACGVRLGRAHDQGRDIPSASGPVAGQVARAGAGDLQECRQGFRQSGHGAVRTRPRNPHRRVPVAARPFRLRQVDGAAAADGPRRADPRRNRLELRSSRIRLRVPGADADALVGRVHQRLAAAAAHGRVKDKARAADRGGAGAGRAVRLRQGLSAPACRAA